MAAGHIAHFEILRELGKGAMGEVYLARDTKLQRLVALKTFPSSAALLHEARLASAVSHPNVAHVYQAEEEYIAMEYVEGETLDKLIARGPLTPERSLDIAIQIASALEEAHRKGVVHRDIKPSNVMLSERGLVKVLDFGLARATAGSAPMHDDAVAGTIAYMSPEQAMGETVDGRSDLFSFGVVLYEMLTGRRPFQGPTVSKTLAQILNVSPPPIERSTRLAGIIARCLEKSPEDRYQNATELLKDLENVRASVPPRQSPRQAVGIAAIVAVVFAVIAATIWQASGQGPLRSVAVLPFTSSGEEEAKAIGDGLAETLINRLSRSGDEVRVVSRPTSFAYDAASLTAPRIGRDLRADTLVTGRISRTGDRVELQVEMIDARRDEQIWGRHYTGSVYDLVRIQEDIAAAIGAELNVPMSRSQEHFVRAAMTRDPEAFRQYVIARHLTNQRLFATLRKSFEHYEAALERDPDFALAHAGVAESWIVLVSKRGVASREGYPKALAAARRAEKLDPYSAEVHTLLGDLHLFHLWDWEGAGRHFQRAIELNPHYVTARHWYGSYLSIMGRHDEAIEQMRIAQQLEPSTSRFIAAEGRVLFAARRYSEAEMMIKRAIELEPDNKNSWDQLVDLPGTGAHRRFGGRLSEIAARRGRDESRSRLCQRRVPRGPTGDPGPPQGTDGGRKIRQPRRLGHRPRPPRRHGRRLPLARGDVRRTQRHAAADFRVAELGSDSEGPSLRGTRQARRNPDQRRALTFFPLTLFFEAHAPSTPCAFARRSSRTAA